MTMPATVGVACPRCTTQIQCTLKPTSSKPGPIGARTALTVPDLAEKFAEHYAQAHPGVAAAALEADRRQTAAAIRPGLQAGA